MNICPILQDMLKMKYAAETNLKKQAIVSKTGDEPSAVYKPSDKRSTDLNEWLPKESDAAFIEQVRKNAGLTEKDNVRIFVVPKGQSRIKPGSVIIKPNTSPQAQQISLSISRGKNRLREIENGTYHQELTDDEKSRKINSIRNDVRRYERALARERARIAKMPRSGWIIVERE